MSAPVPDINFTAIAPRGGSKTSAFEELCSQVAAKTLADDIRFERFQGAGGDGGVECLATFSDGSELGWQAKYVFDIGNLIKQADESLKTALMIHPKLTRYHVCFPFDLDLGHCHVEAGLLSGLILGGEQSLGLCKVRGSEAYALASLPIFGVKHPAAALIDPIPFFHGYNSMLQRIERL